MVLSPQKLWENYNRSLLPLDTSVIRSRETPFGTEKDVYFNGETTALGCTRIYARYLTPPQKTDKMVVYFCDPDTPIDEKDAVSFLQRGWAVLLPDYTGKNENRERFTIYPSALSYANYDKDALYAGADSPQKTCWYIWTTVCLRAFTFAESEGYTRVAAVGEGIGGAHVCKAAAVSDFPVCAVSLFSPGFFPETDDPELLPISVSVNLVGYTPTLKVPFLQICSSNDADASLDAINEYMEQANDNGLLYIMPRSDRRIGSELIAETERFMSAFLDANETPQLSRMAPEITFNVSGGENKLYVSVQCPVSLKCVSVYVSHGITHAAYRNWRSVPVEKIGENEYMGYTEVYAADQPVYAFASVTTPQDFTFTTAVVKKIPSALKIQPAAIVKKRLIYDSEMGIDDFFSEDDDAPVIKSGPFGIDGICAEKGLCTYKLGDVAFSGAPDSVLQLLLFSSVQQTITFSVIDGDQFNTYTCEKVVSPQTDWTKIMLSVSDLKGEGTFPGWHRAIYLRIDAEEEFIISSLLWV